MKYSINDVGGTIYFRRNYTTTYFVKDEDGKEIVLDRPYLVIPTEPLKEMQIIFVLWEQMVDGIQGFYEE